jgi:hypothetical protein
MDRNVCNKNSFDTFGEGQKDVNRAKKMRIYKDGKRIKGRSKKQRPQRVYKCPACGKFHQTHLKRKWRKSASSSPTKKTGGF